MPVPLYTQTVVAFIWDFDRTLIPDNMQGPIFDEYGVDDEAFWEEVDGLVEFHACRRAELDRDTAYLLHLLTYVEPGSSDLTNAKLRELGAKLVPAPGMPEFFEDTQRRVSQIPEFAAEGITVEHYIVSTGIRPMIEGSAFDPHVDGIWANTFVEYAAPPGYLDRLPGCAPRADRYRHLAYTIDNTSKTRALFEINKGVNELRHRRECPGSEGATPGSAAAHALHRRRSERCAGVLDPQRQRRQDARRLRPEPRNNYKQVKQLQEQGRIQGMAEADYRPGKGAYLWLMDSLDQIAREIVENRRAAFACIPNPPGHV